MATASILGMAILLWAGIFVLGTAIFFLTMKLLHHEIEFKYLLLLNFIASVAHSLASLTGSKLIAFTVWFIVVGILLKKWSDVENFWQVAGIVLLNLVLIAAIFFGFVLLLASVFATAAR